MGVKFPKIINWPEPKKHYYEHPLCTLPERLLPIVCDHKKHLVANPKHLAWCMWRYDLLHRACRYHGYETNNPKYPLLDSPETDWPGWKQDELDLMYSAWGCSMAESGPWYRDIINGPVPKPKMTFDEWVDLLTNVEYRYSSLYPDRHAVANHLLMVIGNGYGWTKDGYISRGDGIEEANFWGFTQIEQEIPASIRDPINDLCKTPQIKRAVDYLLEITADYNNLSGKEQREFEDRRWRDRHSDFSSLQKRIKQAEELLEKTEKKRLGAKEYEKQATEKAAEAKRKEEEERAASEKRRLTNLYPPGTYALAGGMPDNAHLSYVREVYRLVRMILDGVATTYGEKGTDRPFSDKERKWAKKVEARCVSLLPELKNKNHGASAGKTRRTTRA